MKRSAPKNPRLNHSVLQNNRTSLCVLSVFEVKSILVKYNKGDHSEVFGILGPMRMNYEKNIALLKFIQNKLNNN